MQIISLLGDADWVLSQDTVRNARGKFSFKGVSYTKPKHASNNNKFSPMTREKVCVNFSVCHLKPNQNNNTFAICSSQPSSYSMLDPRLISSKPSI